MVGIGRVQVRHSKVAATGGIGKWDQSGVEDGHRVAVHRRTNTSQSAKGVDQIVVRKSNKRGCRASTEGAKGAVGKKRTTELLGAARSGDRTHVREVEIAQAGVRIKIRLKALPGHKQATLFQGWHRLVVLDGCFFQPKLLGEKEKCLVALGVIDSRNRQRTADSSTKVVSAI